MSTIPECVRRLQIRLVELAERCGLPSPVFGPPASPSALVAAEAKLGPLPPILRELLACADGMSNLHVYENDPPLEVFSCTELAGAEQPSFATRARGRRGFKTDHALQKGFIFGGGENAALLLTQGPQKGRLTGLPPIDGGRVTIVRFDPPGSAATGSLLEVLEILIAGVGQRLTQEHERQRRTRPTAEDLLARVAEAISTFNYPNEMGEDVHESVEALREIISDFPRQSPVRPSLQRLLAELERGHAGSMRFMTARYRGSLVEVDLDGSWVDVMQVPP